MVLGSRFASAVNRHESKKPAKRNPMGLAKPAGAIIESIAKCGLLFALIAFNLREQEDPGNRKQRLKSASRGCRFTGRLPSIVFAEQRSRRHAPVDNACPIAPVACGHLELRVAVEHGLLSRRHRIFKTIHGH